MSFATSARRAPLASIWRTVAEHLAVASSKRRAHSEPGRLCGEEFGHNNRGVGLDEAVEGADAIGPSP